MAAKGGKEDEEEEEEEKEKEEEEEEEDVALRNQQSSWFPNLSGLSSYHEPACVARRILPSFLSTKKISLFCAQQIQKSLHLLINVGFFGLSAF